jgi:hypothetical protein
MYKKPLQIRGKGADLGKLNILQLFGNACRNLFAPSIFQVLNI